MQVKDIENVIQTWTAQFQELGEMAQIGHVQIFENRGAMMGASNPHPHCQIWATCSVPDIPAKELACQSSYLGQQLTPGQRLEQRRHQHEQAAGQKPAQQLQRGRARGPGETLLLHHPAEQPEVA